jgi:alpha-methylacyl-CoA racemase
MNLLGDLGGGAMYLAFGVATALIHARSSGEGQVVDANIVDGTASLTNFILGLRAQGIWDDTPGMNVLDTGAPFYDTYRCADGAEVAVGALEPQFYAQLMRLCGVDEDDPVLSLEVRHEPRTWPAARKRWTKIFASKPRAEWVAILEGTDACFAPVLSWEEAQLHPHMAARDVYGVLDGVVQAVPAPRMSLTPGSLRSGPTPTGEHTDEILAQLGYGPAEIADHRSQGCVG